MMETTYSGLDVCKGIRSDPNLKDIPIIGISGIGDEMGIQIDKWGDDDYFSVDESLKNRWTGKNSWNGLKSDWKKGSSKEALRTCKTLSRRYPIPMNDRTHSCDYSPSVVHTNTVNIYLKNEDTSTLKPKQIHSGEEYGLWTIIGTKRYSAGRKGVCPGRA